MPILSPLCPAAYQHPLATGSHWPVVPRLLGCLPHWSRSAGLCAGGKHHWLLLKGVGDKKNNRAIFVCPMWLRIVFTVMFHKHLSHKHLARPIFCDKIYVLSVIISAGLLWLSQDWWCLCASFCDRQWENFGQERRLSAFNGLLQLREEIVPVRKVTETNQRHFKITMRDHSFG